MKKVLLFAFTVFSMSGIAQHIGTMKPVEGFKPKADSKFEMAKRIDFSQLKPSMQTKAVTEPEGTKTSYFLDYYDYVRALSYCMRSHVSADIYYAEDGTVYISNMFFTNDQMFGTDLYITGKLNTAGDSIIIDNNQLLGTLYDSNDNPIEFYICTVDTTAESYPPLLSTNFVLKVGTNGVLSSDQYTYLGIYGKVGDDYYWYSDCIYLNYIPANLFPEAITCDYTFNNYYGESKQATVKMIDLGSEVYISSLIPEWYPKAWLYGVKSNNNIIIPSYQVADDDVMFAYMSSSDYLDYSTLTYDADKQTYTSEANVALGSFFYYQGDDTNKEGVYFDETVTNMVITPIQTAINTVEASDKVVASTEYYDLSGRRIFLDDTTKGMCIKVVRYTDGTSNAIKMMR